MGLPAPVVEWLSQQLQYDYVDPARCFGDVTQTLMALGSLRPKTDVYTSETGHPQLLLNLSGPLPTAIDGHVYGIPIEIWIPKQYPSLPPIVYVRPTSEMLIAPGQFVDTNGRCHFDWTPQADLLGVLSMLQERFSFEPPVYAKPPPGAEPPQPTHVPEPTLVSHPPTDPDRSKSSKPAPKTQYEPVKDIMNSINEPVPLPAKPASQKADAISNLDAALQTVVAQIHSEEIDKDDQALEHASEVLDWVESALGDEKQQLEAAVAQHQTNVRQLRDRISDAKQATEQATTLSDRGVPTDELVVAQSPRQSQIIAAATEAEAIGDTIYLLSKALDGEVITMDIFIKNVRALAREQFMARALALKASGQPILDSAA